MAGRRTSLRFPHSLSGEVTPLEVTHNRNFLKECLRDLESAIGRRLKDDELVTISSRCAVIKTSVEILESSGQPTAQDIRRELKAIASSDDASAWSWYCIADPWTICEIDTARLRHLNLQKLINESPKNSARRGRLQLYAYDLSNAIPEVIAPSAAIALERFISKASNRTGSRPRKHGVTELAEFAAATWKSVGGKPRDAKGKKKWAETLFYLCDINPPDYRDLERLMKGVRRR